MSNQPEVAWRAEVAVLAIFLIGFFLGGFAAYKTWGEQDKPIYQREPELTTTREIDDWQYRQFIKNFSATLGKDLWIAEYDSSRGTKYPIVIFRRGKDSLVVLPMYDLTKNRFFQNKEGASK
jgi:hypothetical protein